MIRPLVLSACGFRRCRRAAEALEELQTFEHALASQADAAASEADDSGEGDAASEVRAACSQAAEPANATPSRPCHFHRRRLS